MHTRTLGRDLHVSALGLGCMGMSQAAGPTLATGRRARSQGGLVH